MSRRDRHRVRDPQSQPLRRREAWVHREPKDRKARGKDDVVSRASALFLESMKKFGDGIRAIQVGEQPRCVYCRQEFKLEVSGRTLYVTHGCGEHRIDLRDARRSE